MRDAHPHEHEFGIAYYLSDTDGTAGKLRTTPDDFVVNEIQSITPEPIESDETVYRHLLIRSTVTDWDTNAFAKTLANRLGISRERISWAGTKDKRAITTQLFSIDGIDPGSLPIINDATIEPVGRFGRRLLFGDLAGNQFTITVKDPGQPENAPPITEELNQFGHVPGTIGVPNYFGHQRFGSIRPITHRVGLAIIRGNWKQAVLTYIGSPTPDEPPDTRSARKFIDETENWTEALNRMPERMGHERTILHSLSETSSETTTEFQAAITALPRNLQQLFVHAAQSYLFNKILNERLAASIPITEAIAGDVVCFTDTINGMTIPDTNRTERISADRVDTVNRLIHRGRAFVTAPLIGTNTDLATGKQGDIEKRILDEHNLTQSDFDLLEPFNSTGTRRPILVTTKMEVQTDPFVFTFDLPRGSYATIVLREYLKSSPFDL